MKLLLCSFKTYVANELIIIHSKIKIKIKSNYNQRNSTLPAEVSTMSDECSTDCKNLKTRFQFPLHRFKSSICTFLLIPAYMLCNAQSWDAAKSTNDRNFWGYNPWLPPNVLEVNSKCARSTAESRPEVKISKIKWEGNSSIENNLYLSAISQQFSLYQLQKDTSTINRQMELKIAHLQLTR